MSRSPDKPWIPGVQETYTAFRLVVNICQDEHGNVWSDHNFVSDEDMNLAGGLPSGGAPQVAHSLLTEAVRREAFLCALIEQSKGSEYLAQWMAADDTAKGHLEADLQRVVKTTITRTLEKMVPGAVAEVLAMMADQA